MNNLESAIAESAALFGEMTIIALFGVALSGQEKGQEQQQGDI